MHILIHPVKRFFLFIYFCENIISLSLSPPTDHHKHRIAERKLYGVEGSSTFLECIPKSLQAKVTWTFQKHPQNPRAEVRRIINRNLWKSCASNIFRRFYLFNTITETRDFCCNFSHIVNFLATWHCETLQNLRVHA